jgi:hypothetical protein
MLSACGLAGSTKDVAKNSIRIPVDQKQLFLCKLQPFVLEAKPLKVDQS